MFGGLATVPSNSPHLRKSGSRPVVSDLGTISVWVMTYEFCGYCLDYLPWGFVCPSLS